MSGLKTAGPIQFHFAFLLLLFLLFSCAKGKDDTEGEDRSIPAVESIVPDNAAIGFSTTGSITITFSKPIDKQTSRQIRMVSVQRMFKFLRIPLIHV